MGDIYDARIDGGFPEPAALRNQCAGDQCQGGLTLPPALPTTVALTLVEPSSTGHVTARVTVLSRTVHGSRFRIALRVPAPGRIAITGSRLRPVTRSVAKPGMYRIRVALTPTARRMLRRGKTLNLELFVGYAPVGGERSTATVALRVEQ